MLTGTTDLDDVAQLQDADVDGFLRAGALAGAQVRAVGAAVEEGVLEPLTRARPRAVVIVVGRGTARDAAALVVSTMASYTDVPLVVTPVVPGWIGPLDVVVVAGDDAGDRRLADAAARAVRRHAELVLDVPVEGPVAESAAGNGLDLSPRVPAPAQFRFAGHVAALLAVIAALTEVRTTGARFDAAALADVLDDEASAAHPANESFHNAAKSLAGRVEGRTGVWAGATPAATAVAAHAARTFYAVAGLSGTACDLDDAIVAASRPVGGSAAPIDPLFHDPDFDPPLATVPTRVQVITTPTSEWSVHHRVSAIGDADVLAATDAEPLPSPTSTGDSPADIEPLLVLALRIDMAAVYLRLVGSR
ncbi:hypothetical protein [Williamsia deligens]|uniref:Phospho-glucose isomerase C-terminal SIS domain-containing protein n=1 Tax=Williamsia deligens TaxID=321325 RepID=A0ABW3G578_9NOCA|nr:hypothetical protein [Williamsia deligens]